MDIEGAIIVLGKGGWRDEFFADIREVGMEPLQEALDTALDSLAFRLSFEEMKKKQWEGCEMCGPGANLESEAFCRHCVRPLTDETLLRMKMRLNRMADARILPNHTL